MKSERKLGLNRAWKEKEAEEENWGPGCVLAPYSECFFIVFCSKDSFSPEAAAKQLLSQGITAVRVRLLLLVLRWMQAYFLFVDVRVCVELHCSNSPELLFYLQVFVHLYFIMGV